MRVKSSSSMMYATLAAEPAFSRRRVSRMTVESLEYRPAIEAGVRDNFTSKASEYRASPLLGDAGIRAASTVVVSWIFARERRRVVSEYADRDATSDEDHGEEEEAWEASGGLLRFLGEINGNWVSCSLPSLLLNPRLFGFT
ncbi:uncharacterized protein [Temnothorax longispinosus]|uniref:uncharacterized protein isoform X1 n=1 Tax=Temnothorax longispinosus TaxID=300112 RepID=UPI003A99A129